MLSLQNVRPDGALYSLHLALDGALKAAMKLSSGDRIFSAAVDPSGLIISETLRDRIASLRQETRNVALTISKYDTATATVTELREQLIDLRSLAVAAANDGINSPEAYQAYSAAAKALVNSYNRTIESASFNGRPTLDGSDGSLAKVDKLPALDLSSANGARAALHQIDLAADKLDVTIGDLGSRMRGELSQIKADEIELQNLIAAESQIRDTDFAAEYSRYVANMIKTYTSIAALSHSFMTARTVLSLVG